MRKRNENLDRPVSDLKGVGPAITRGLAGRAIHTIEDLLFFLPTRYEDRREIRTISDIEEGRPALIVARVLTQGSLSFRRGRKAGYQAVVTDDTGTICLKWFHHPPRYLKESASKGTILMISGKVTRFGEQMQIVHPDIIPLENEEESREYKAVIPLYPEIEGVKRGILKRLLKKAFEDHGASLESVIPVGIESRHGLPSLREALEGLHFPHVPPPLSDEDFVERKRLIIEEFFLFQAAVLLEREEGGRFPGIELDINNDLYRATLGNLTFDLTSAQQRVLEEIEGDMAGLRPMNRLLQGDVGSGKTILAVLASCIAVGNGFQAAFMAPTEILAEQHYLTVHRMFEETGVPVFYLRGDMGKERGETLRRMESEKSFILIGTHALLQKDVTLTRLGLVVVDEQHRFGVSQRRTLKQKGFMPHVLVMSATPIPRTLSLVLHGDLDVSILDELPRGRQRIATHVLPDSLRSEAYRIIEAELEKGRQAYMVYPLVEQSEKVELLDATAMASHAETLFPGRKIGLLHGKMKPREKEQIMSAFKAGEVDVLVCTTVVEVGIDVPNATVIAVEHAERFGLSQLHQLRGRVGRSTFPSKCLLLTHAKRTEQASRRLKILAKTNDGFLIAEEDLKIRGAGEMLGLRQSGLTGFRIGDLRRDGEAMALAREMAVEALKEWSNPEADEIKAIIAEKWSQGLNVFNIA